MLKKINKTKNLQIPIILVHNMRVLIVDDFFKKIILISICFSLLGCGSGHTVVSKTHFYPHDKDIDSAQYRLEVVVHGQKGHAYSENTQKKLFLTIWDNTNKVLNREYSLTASSLEWAVTWSEVNDLSILFFDFGEGISIYDKDAVKVPAKHIFSLHFTYDTSEKKFIEYPIDQAVVRELKKSGSTK